MQAARPWPLQLQLLEGIVINADNDNVGLLVQRTPYPEKRVVEAPVELVAPERQDQGDGKDEAAKSKQDLGE